MHTIENMPDGEPGKIGLKTHALLALTLITALFAGSAFASFSVNTAATFVNSAPVAVIEEPISMNAVSVNIKEYPKPDLAIAGNTRNVGRFAIRAHAQAARLHSISFSIEDPDGGIVGGQDELTTMHLYRQASTTPMGSVSVTGDTGTIYFYDFLPAWTKGDYVLKAEFANLNDASPAQSGAGFSLKLSNVDARGNLGINLPVYGLGDTFSTFTSHKSLPTIGVNIFNGENEISNGLNNQVVDLYKFDVQADSAGPVGLYKYTFQVTPNGVTVNPGSYTLYESDSEFVLGNVISAPSDFVVTSSTAPTVEAYFDVNNDHPAGSPHEHRIIGAGSTKYYTLRGTLTGVDSIPNNESVMTYMLWDAEFAGDFPKNAHEVDQGWANELIWSDLNFDLYSTSTAPKNAGWFNGFRVDGMDYSSSSVQIISD